MTMLNASYNVMTQASACLTWGSTWLGRFTPEQLSQKKKKNLFKQFNDNSTVSTRTCFTVTRWTRTYARTYAHTNIIDSWGDFRTAEDLANNRSVRYRSLQFPPPPITPATFEIHLLSSRNRCLQKILFFTISAFI